MAFLGMLALGLAIAYLIVHHRSPKTVQTAEKLINRIKHKGIDAFLVKRERRNLFVIKNAADKSIGFTMDLITNEPNDSNRPIRLASYLYIRGIGGKEQLSFFESSPTFEDFVWTTKTIGAFGTTSAVRIKLSKAGYVSVTNLARPGRQHSFQPPPASIPSPLLDLLLAQLAESDVKQVLVNVIEDSGTPTPTFISRIKNVNSNPSNDQAYAFSLQPLVQGKAFRATVYLNRHKTISKIILHQAGGYTFIRTSAEEIVNLFPERANYILQTGRLPYGYNIDHNLIENPGGRIFERQLQ